MATEWTAKQAEAINAEGCNILVDAAAGSGKTAVLVERIIRKITDKTNPTDIDSLLIVTFTRAAANEMSERIGHAITQRLKDDPLNQNLRRQAVLLNKAQITTIDAFCLTVIRNNFHLLDIDPAFKIGDDTEIEIIKQDAVDALFDDMYELEDNSGFLSFCSAFSSGYYDDDLKQTVLDIYRYVTSLAFGNRWLREKLEMFSCDDFENSIWIKTITDSAKVAVDDCVITLKRAIGELEGDEKHEKYLINLKNDLQTVKYLQSSMEKDWDTIKQTLDGTGFANLSIVKNADGGIKEFVQKTRGEVKERIANLKENVFCSELDKLKSDIIKMSPHIRMLVELVQKFEEYFTKRKAEKSLLDFNDIEHLCLSLLAKETADGIEPTETAVAMRERFNEILIDEYQDSNQLQDTIFTLISNGHNMFVVGDIKQSIYRFRHTDLQLFKAKKEAYPEDGEGINRKITLSNNFRSREQVVDAVNSLFDIIMSEKLGGVEYDYSQKLNASAYYPPQERQAECAEINIIQTEREQRDEDVFDTTQQDDEEDISATEMEAMMVAKRIKQLIADGFTVFDKNANQYRPIEFKDILILMRSTKNRAAVFSDVLNAQGIDTFADTSDYFMQTEIKTMLALLSIIDNPKNDIALLGVMRSVIAEFTDDEIARIRLADRKCDIYTAVRQYAFMDGMKTSDKKFIKNGSIYKVKVNDRVRLLLKCRRFLNKLNAWRDYAKFMPCHEMIWKLYNETGYYAMAATMSGGVGRQANLRLLFERARAFESGGARGLFAFINFMQHVNDTSKDMSSAKMINESHNVVQIMSIHKSKGLEKPVVFVSTTAKRFNMQELSTPLVIDSSLGIGCDVHDDEYNVSYPSVSKTAIREKNYYESLSEEMRILYVALTRAREKLIITANVKNADKKLNAWKSKMHESVISLYELSRTSSYIDWIAPVALNNGVVCGCGHTLHGGLWKTVIYTPDDVKFEQTAYETRETASSSVDFDKIKTVLEYKYPYSDNAGIKDKVSVSEIKRLNYVAEEDEELPPLVPMPEFMQAEKITPAQAGTITHFVMQKLDLSMQKSVREQFDAMVENGVLTSVQAGAVNVAAIEAFFDSEPGRRMTASEKVFRETAFEIAVPANIVYKKEKQGHDNSETVLVQGIIDCWFYEEDGIVLIDYKTDRVKDKNVILARYKDQLDYYAMALEKMTDKKVKDKFIYLFSANDVVKCD